MGTFASGSRGTITAVMPTYGVAEYLPEFLASIDRQSGDLTGVEFVFVDDGSPDDSAEIITDWIAQHPALDARLVRKENGGLSSARNAGLDVATGEWVTFPDPDDFFSPGYWAAMTTFVRSPKADKVHIVAGRFIYFNEDTATESDTHPLRFRFDEGTRVIDLGRHPYFIHVAANTGLFRREVMQQYDLRYDGRIQPVWEDGHLTARYLSKFERPRIAMIAEAQYFYRRRSDGSSLMDGQWRNPGKFLSVPRGWLDALRIAAAEHDGSAPPWIQNMVLYDIMGYFKQERRSPSPTAAVPRDVSDGFFELLAECLEHIDVDAVDAYRVTRIDVEIRNALRMYFKKCDPRPTTVFIDRMDSGRGLVRLHWFYTGDAPVEEFRARGFTVAPVFAKTRPCSFYGRTLLTERVVWLPSDGSLSVTLDGTRVPLRVGPVETRAMLVGPTAIRAGLVPDLDRDRDRPEPKPRPAGLRPALGRLKRDGLERIRDLRDEEQREQRRADNTVRLADTPYFRRKFAGAWLLIDRDSQAKDNAEHLYRWLRDNRPDVNAWFVLARESNDWDRLAKDGFRLLAHKSREHEIALLNCEHVVSSQIDGYITSPLPARLFGKDRVNTWHYTFLQHGVTKDDLSIWINPKPIELMITATPAERDAIVADTSPYIWGDHEVALTGFPRHDRLHRLATGEDGRDPKLILVMPTWRRGLVLDQVAGGNDRALRADFWSSEYARQWRTVIESQELHRLADEHGYRIAFVPHPNMQTYLDSSPLPDWVQVYRFRDVDIQQLLARSAALVTDYSSMGFEMAYIERPVVYFQFDQEDFFDGGHAYRRGTWRYETDGFGPVTTQADEAVAAVAAVMRRDGAAEPVYAERMRDTFPFRDGRCSQRTYDAIAAITKRMPYDERYLKLDPKSVLDGRPVAEELQH
ncbi:CDP-glycerol glycerophosphotransferase, TagB/SpsB family [Jatrophihabitans endophyticus]|uniref:CDP-glycerol glycerophosphotransferase, TagB/SpsB family n=1 Tax=Jatrophihabitans endophyticus TaxID=1206085 RepID=A0A1M5I3X8_9ACTN|nr:CDP-glycerol glycerophosphotransferase family protein [Jatrophihabitans endophyticus]SHG22789.1 CDP-glycerol glycerophosphotransferase, TagB/SpsB family [Jatrophihabitans endophyticus]